LELRDLNALVQNLNSIRERRKEKQNEQKKAEVTADQQNKEAERLRKLSLITGKSFDSGDARGETRSASVESDIKELIAEETKLENQIATGIAELKFPIKDKDPEISDGNAIFSFEEGVYDPAIDYIKLSLSMKEQLTIDNVVFYPNKILIKGKSQAGEATGDLLNAVQSIWSLGSIMLGKIPDQMKETIDSLKESKYNYLWEFLGRLGNISLQEVYRNFKYESEADKKNARTFYSQLESRFKQPIAIGDGKGNFQLTFYGRLVFASYRKSRGISGEKVEEREQTSSDQVKGPQPKEEARKPSQTALQNFMEKVLLNKGD
jgi:hypothetical protein